MYFGKQFIMGIGLDTEGIDLKLIKYFLLTFKYSAGDNNLWPFFDASCIMILAYYYRK